MQQYLDLMQRILDEGAAKMVINLADVSYVSSAGIRCVLMLGKKLLAKSGRLVLCSANDTITEVLTISGVSGVVLLLNNEAEAILQL